MIKNYKSSNGITMIMLTITIVIMIVLAGVAMIEITGDAGIVKEVEKSRKKIETEQNTTQNKINEIQEDWGTVLSQNNIENEVGSR